MATRGERIKQLMKENKISAKELAEYIQATVGHISVGYIYKIMRDEVESPNIEILKAIAKKLDTDLNYLEGERDNILYLTEPVIYDHLPEDLKKFVASEENTPYIVLAKQLKNYDLSKITTSDIEFLIGALRYHIKNNVEKDKNC